MYNIVWDKVTLAQNTLLVILNKMPFCRGLWVASDRCRPTMRHIDCWWWSCVTHLWRRFFGIMEYIVLIKLTTNTNYAINLDFVNLKWLLWSSKVIAKSVTTNVYT